MAASVRVPMCMSDNMAEYFVEVGAPVTLRAIKDAAGKKFKDFRPKKGRAYHSVTGEELTDEIVASMFSGVGGAGVVLSGKEWRGAAKLRERYAASCGLTRGDRGEPAGARAPDPVCASGVPLAAADAAAAPAVASPLPLSAPVGAGAACERAARFLRGAEAVLVLAGAGMGVDSGLGTFRSKDGSYTKEEYMLQARHAMFEEDPSQAWRWHGHMLERFRAVMPHDGYAKLLEICNFVGDYFVCTSNIDGAFLKAGYPCERLFEAHGSVHVWQCTDSKCNRNQEPWPAEAINLDKGLPQCKRCGGLARPNVALFDDGLGRNARSFNSRYIDPQKARFATWLKQLVARRVVVVEVGCGVSEHSLRMACQHTGTWACMSGEWKIPSLVCPLIRVDPSEEDPEAVDSFVHVACGAKDAFTLLAEHVFPSLV